MKWKNRLQTVLTQGTKNENSKECLKTQLRITAESPNRLVSAVIRSDEFRHFPKNYDELADLKSEKLHAHLNRFIENGITFDVSADDFQIIDTGQFLKTSDKEFLQINNQEILCQLQQSLLMKHLFSIAPELFEDFACLIAERESIIAESGLLSDKIHFQVVRQTTERWFADLLGNFNQK